VASIRCVYSDVPIKLLAGGALEHGLEEELRRYWNIGIAALPRGDWGWGFIKLEPLFGPPGERYLVMDSDTVMAGPVLDLWTREDAPFVVDEEEQTEAATKRLYYNWRQVAGIDPLARAPQFVFNTGQWFGTAGLLTRTDFAQLLDWAGMPPRLRHAGYFKNGEQGLLNYVLNQKAALDGLAVARRKIMLWPGHGMDGVTAAAVAERRAPPRIIHWAGMKAGRIGAMVGADILAHFERIYYARLPQGRVRRTVRQIAYPVIAARDAARTRASLRWRRMVGA
jgi:hypothetical protein